MPARATTVYIMRLTTDPCPPHIQATTSKPNTPIPPQFNAPIIVNIKAILSITAIPYPFAFPQFPKLCPFCPRKALQSATQNTIICGIIKHSPNDIFVTSQNTYANAIFLQVEKAQLVSISNQRKEFLVFSRFCSTRYYFFLISTVVFSVFLPIQTSFIKLLI